MNLTNALAWLLASSACLVACSEPRGPLTVHNDDPAVKIPAIKLVASTPLPGKAGQGDDEAQMVKDLSSDDPAVRFYSIQGLVRLTGQTFGFRYFDEEDLRQAAVARWKQWLAARSSK